MEALDFPDLGLLSPVRGNTNSALQSLSLYNNRFVIEHSKMMAESIERQQTDHALQIELVFHALSKDLQRIPNGTLCSGCFASMDWRRYVEFS